jgi:hypothetical protein
MPDCGSIWLGLTGLICSGVPLIETGSSFSCGGLDEQQLPAFGSGGSELLLEFEELWLWVFGFGAQQDPTFVATGSILEWPFVPFIGALGAQHDPPLVALLRPFVCIVGVGGLSTA